MELEKIFVSSSNVEAIGYDSESETLKVWFLNGSAYQYLSVPFAIFEGLKDAPSVGSYLHQNVKGQYTFERVE